jgi:DNA-binding beta-propeller fold protein YncE
VQNPSDGVVVATQLLNPRGLTIAPNGTLYIAEAGSGGPEPIVDPDFGPSTRGFTGRVTAIARDGTRTVIADGLPSTALGGFEPLGPAGVTFARGRLYLAVGLTNAGYAPRSGDASVYDINPHNRKRSILTYLGGYEFAQNPDGFGLESNPYGIAYSGGSLYVADAGGNSLYRIDPRTGQFTLVTVFAGLPLPFPFENGGRGGANEEDPVPTGLAGARDGVYVTLLGGFPFARGLTKRYMSQLTAPSPMLRWASRYRLRRRWGRMARYSSRSLPRVWTSIRSAIIPTVAGCSASCPTGRPTS